MAVSEAFVALIAGRSGSLRHFEPGEVPGRTAGGEGERDRGRAIHIRIAADFGPIVGESEVGRFDDGIGDSAGAIPFGEAEGFGVQAADGGVCDDMPAFVVAAGVRSRMLPFSSVNVPAMTLAT